MWDWGGANDFDVDSGSTHNTIQNVEEADSIIFDICIHVHVVMARVLLHF